MRQGGPVGQAPALRSRGRKYGSEFRETEMIYRNLNPRGRCVLLPLPLDELDCLIEQFSIYSIHTCAPKTTGVSVYLFFISVAIREDLEDEERWSQSLSEGNRAFLQWRPCCAPRNI